MAWRGSLSRSLMSTARASTFRSSPPLAAGRLRPPPVSAPRRLSFSNPRTLGELGCVQSLMPLHNMAGVRLTSHLAINVRACCELSHDCTCFVCGEAYASKRFETYASPHYKKTPRYLNI